MTRKLIEVALPLEAISAACKRDKDRKTGTIRNVHKWFAPMPLPAWRALLFAALVDDPGDDKERAHLLQLITRLVPADAGPPPVDALIEAKRLVRAGGSPPTVLDPFCGGGSTIVEAQRLGLEAIGSDLNPVPVLISRTICQLVPSMAGRGPVVATAALSGVGGPLDGFLADVRHYAERVRDVAWKQVGHLYPPAPAGGTVIAWLWARTVACPNPACRAIIPLYSSPWLSKRKGEERWLRPVVEAKAVRFEIGEGKANPPAATKLGRGATFRCPVCSESAPEPHVKAEGKAKRIGEMLLCTVIENDRGRSYLAPHDRISPVSPPEEVPEVELPDYGRWFSSPAFGMRTHADLYSSRQLQVLAGFADAVADVPAWVVADGGSRDYAVAVATVLGLCVGKLAQSNSTQVRWNARVTGSSKAEPAFSRHALPMVWDYTETNPFGTSVGAWSSQVQTVASGLLSLPLESRSAKVVQADARAANAVVPAGTALLATDPPYFDHIGYADLSDYFYVWHRRALRAVHPDLFATITTPKDSELIAAPYRHGGSGEAARRYFVEGFTETFRSLRAASRPDLPIIVVYAHRQEESEEVSLASMMGPSLGQCDGTTCLGSPASAG